MLREIKNAECGMQQSSYNLISSFISVLTLTRGATVYDKCEECGIYPIERIKNHN